jgi:hypothetical protein
MTMFAACLLWAIGRVFTWAGNRLARHHTARHVHDWGYR